MELTELHSFIVVAEELNFNRAAARLHITQPALSQRIRNLERDLGTLLFERSSKQVRLTKTGAGLVDSARHVVAEAARLRTQAKYLARQDTGILVLAHTRSAGVESAAVLLKAFRQRHPGVALETSMGFTARNIQGVLDGELDVAFARAYSREASELEHLTLWSDPVVVAVPTGHRLAGRQEVHRMDIVGEPLVFFREQYAPDMWHLILDGIYGSNPERKITQFEPDESLMLTAVAAGAGITLLTGPAAEMLELQGVVLKKLQPAIFVPLYLVWRGDNTNRSLACFLDTARAIAASRRPPRGGA